MVHAYKAATGGNPDGCIEMRFASRDMVNVYTKRKPVPEVAVKDRQWDPRHLRRLF